MTAEAPSDVLVVLSKDSQQKWLTEHITNDLWKARVLQQPTPQQLKQALTERKPMVILCDLNTENLSVRELSGLASELRLTTHIVAVASSRSTRAIIRAMGQGARDLVSQEDPLHLQLVIARELGVLQAWCQQNAKQLQPFIEDDEARATLDGIRIVECRPPFAKLLGADSAEKILNTAFLKYVDGDHHHAVKQFLQRCAQGENIAHPLAVNIVRLDGTRTQLIISVKTKFQDDKISFLLTARTDRRTIEAAASPQVVKPPKPIDPAVTQRLQNALKQNQLSLVVQPISNLVGQADRQYNSMLDIYVMLKDEEGELPARKFIQEARATGLIRYVDRWVMHNACMLLKAEVQKQGAMLVFLRLSRQSLHDPTLVQSLKHEIKQHGIPSAGLAFEMSEKDLAELNDDELNALKEVKEAGFLLSVSGYGIDPKQQDLPKQLGFDFIKLDPSFGGKAEHSEKTRQVIQGIVQSANANGQGVVFSQVPNATTLAALWTLGIHYVQGNYLHEPVTVNKLR